MEPKKGPYPLLSQRITGIWLNRRDYITAELQARSQSDLTELQSTPLSHNGLSVILASLFSCFFRMENTD